MWLIFSACCWGKSRTGAPSINIRQRRQDLWTVRPPPLQNSNHKGWFTPALTGCATNCEPSSAEIRRLTGSLVRLGFIDWFYGWNSTQVIHWSNAPPKVLIIHFLRKKLSKKFNIINFTYCSIYCEHNNRKMVTH